MITRYVAIGIFASMLVSTAVQAQSAAPAPSNTTGNHQKAKQMFKDAWQAANERNHDKACPMFDAALALDPDYQKAAIASAQCYEEAGKYVTAVNRYLRAQEVAAKQAVQDPKMLNLISTGLTAATSKISYVTIYVPGPVGSIPGISVSLNGNVVDPANYGTKIPLDGGKYQIVTTAPKHIPRKIEFEIKGASHDFYRTLVPLEIDPQPAKTPETQAKSEPSTNVPTPSKAEKHHITGEPKPRDTGATRPKRPKRESPDSTFTNSAKGSSASVSESQKTENSVSIGGGGALIVVGSACVLFGSLLAVTAATRTDDDSTYVAGSVAGFAIGAASLGAGIAVVSSSSPPKPEKQTAFQIQSPTVIIGPGHITFQAHW